MVRVQGVPFLDLSSQTALIRDELDAALAAAIDASDFVLGPRVEALSRRIAGARMPLV